MLREPFFGEFKRDGFGFRSHSPLRSPFPTDSADAHPWNADVAASHLSDHVYGARIRNSWAFSISDGHASAVIPLSLFRCGYGRIWSVPIVRHDSRDIALLTLKDSANTFSPSQSGNQRSLEKHTRIHVCYIRDGVGRYNLSFAAAGFNVADCGGELKGAVHFAAQIWAPSRCFIGFLSRVAMHRVRNSSKELTQGADQCTVVR